MDKNQGYEIIQAVMLENGRGFALGHHPTAPSPYVTWACYDDKDGQRQYEWGHYGSDRAALEQETVGYNECLLLAENLLQLPHCNRQTTFLKVYLLRCPEPKHIFSPLCNGLNI